MVNINTINIYKNQQIMTSSPEELTLLLYDGAIRFISESITSIEKGNLQHAHNANIRAQDIVNELKRTLDMKYELAQNWLLLYEYILHCLFEGNIGKDKTQLLQAKSLLSELREAWVGAMEIVCPKQAENNIQDHQSKQLWLDYRLLTKEMVKFLGKQDMKLFYERMNQRKRLRERIDQLANDEFRNSDEGQRLLIEIRSDSQFISNELQGQLIGGTGGHCGSTAYDSRVGSPISHMSWEK